MNFKNSTDIQTLKHWMLLNVNTIGYGAVFLEYKGEMPLFL